MTATMHRYTPADFIRVRDFLVASHDTVGESHNWHIARWNFNRYVGQVFHLTNDFWAKTLGIWEDESDCIVAVVGCEDEAGGDVHIQLANRNLPDSLLHELLRHAEAELPLIDGQRRVVRPILPEGDEQLEAVATQRGYIKTDRREVILAIDPRTTPAPTLPPGFALTDGREIRPEQMSRAHSAAFGIEDESEYTPRSRQAFAYIREAPDYRADLDVYVVNESRQPVAFCCMWHDQANRAGHLEPVGTNPGYRRLGLGRSAIYEGLRRIAAEGAITATVGSNQQFYKSIGFAPFAVRCVWEKIF